MAALGFRGFPIYFVIGGFIWVTVDASGIHATVTGVILGLMTPARRWASDDCLYAILKQVIAHPTSDDGSGVTRNRNILQMVEVAARETLSPVERLEIALHPWVGFVIMPLFAFANAGVSLSMDTLGAPVTLAVFVGFVVGKSAGILSFSWLAVRAGIAIRPPELSGAHCLVGACSPALASRWPCSLPNSVSYWHRSFPRLRGSRC